MRNWCAKEDFESIGDKVPLISVQARNEPFPIIATSMLRPSKDVDASDMSDLSGLAR